MKYLFAEIGKSFIDAVKCPVDTEADQTINAKNQGQKSDHVPDALNCVQWHIHIAPNSRTLLLTYQVHRHLVGGERVT